jgi:hypothetical protein
MATAASSDSDEESWTDAASNDSDEEDEEVWVDAEELDSMRDLVTHVAEAAKAPETVINSLNATDPETLRQIIEILRDTGKLFPDGSIHKRPAPLASIHSVLRNAIQETVEKRAQTIFESMCKILEKKKWNMRDADIFYYISIELGVTPWTVADTLVESGWYAPVSPTFLASIPQPSDTYSNLANLDAAVDEIFLRQYGETRATVPASKLIPDKAHGLHTIDRKRGLYLRVDTREVYVDLPRYFFRALRQCADRQPDAIRMLHALRAEGASGTWPLVRLVPYFLVVRDALSESLYVKSACDAEIIALVNPPPLSTLQRFSAAVHPKNFSIYGFVLRIFVTQDHDPILDLHASTPVIVYMLNMLFPVFFKNIDALAYVRERLPTTPGGFSIYNVPLWALATTESLLRCEMDALGVYSFSWPRVRRFASIMPRLYFEATLLFQEFGRHVDSLRIRSESPVSQVCLMPQARFLEACLSDVDTKPEDYRLALLHYYAGSTIPFLTKPTQSLPFHLDCKDADIVHCPPSVITYLLQHHAVLMRSLVEKCEISDRGHVVRGLLTSALVGADEVHKHRSIRHMLHRTVPLLLKSLKNVLSFIDAEDMKGIMPTTLTLFQHTPFAEEIFRAIDPTLWQQVPANLRNDIAAAIEPKVLYGKKATTVTDDLETMV